MEINSSATHLLSRSKKPPPPPLCLPATNSATGEEKISDSQTQRERKKSANSRCASSTADECPHSAIPYILPTSQRAQILETLIANSSALLTAPSSEGKYKRSANGTYANWINVLKQRQSAAKLSVGDAEWLDLMRLIVHKSFEQDLKSLLDKYKLQYFDRVNAPSITDDTIRSSLCNMVAEALSTYSSPSALPAALRTNDLAATINNSSSSSSSPPLINSITNGSAKRKRKSLSNSLSLSAPMAINNQTKFVLSYLIPGRYEANNQHGNKSTNQQRQFQRKYSHLFKYIPENDVQEYLMHEDYLKGNSSTSPPTDSSLCLMLYDEVITHMDEYDLQISGISLDECFTLPNSLVALIDGSSQ